METPDDVVVPNTSPSSSPWTSATNWSVPPGRSLANHVTFDDGDSPNPAAQSSSLLLHPPSPDFGPCEITINFTQKHEVQQIYVRSTARVYEIYYAPNIQSDSEYLCTVRCGIASREEEVLHAVDNEEARSAHSDGSLKNLSEENLRNGNNLSTSEDDWVEVKVADTHVLDNKISSLPLKFGSPQAFYEATAQMSDVNPCISLTLRLLSLERKDCVYVDEIYVFADLADSADLENEVNSTDAAGSSIMAMFMPTLLQLSKTRSVNQTQDSLMTGSKVFDSTNAATKIEKPSIPDHQEVMFQDADRVSVGSIQSQIPLQAPASESHSYTPNCHVERSMDLLFSRIGRIEDLLLSFEEKMVNPIRSIEARLDRVEQQLEVVTKQSKNSGLSACSRFCAPSFSCIESDSNSFNNSGNDCSSCEAVILGENDAQSEALPTTPCDMSDSVSSTKLVPGLVVRAECSSDDEEEEEHASGLLIHPSENKPKPALTIDDALASALAGFLSLTSTQPQKYVQTLSIKAPDFLDDSPEPKAPERVEEIGRDPTMSFDESDVTQNAKDLLADASKISSCSGGDVISSTDEHLVEPDEICVQHQHYAGREEGKLDNKSSENVVDPARHGMARICFSQITEENENGVVSTEIINIPSLDETDIPNELPQKETGDGYDTTQDGTNTKEAVEDNPDEDLLKNILEFSRASSLVNFELPVLDVKFSSRESSNTASSLEALLSESSEPVIEAPSGTESDDAQKYVQTLSIKAPDFLDDSPEPKAPERVEEIGRDPSMSFDESDVTQNAKDLLACCEESHLISVEDGETVGPAPDGSFSLDMNFYSVAEPLSTWGVDLQCDTSNSHETFATSLI